MGQLATQFGFYGENSGLETGAESLKVIDNNEAFEFEILASDNKGTSAIWVAQRIPDDHASVTPNIFVIREIDFQDKFNFMTTPEETMVKLANESEIDLKYRNGKLDFSATFGNGEYNNKYYSGRRQWRALSLMAPKLM